MTKNSSPSPLEEPSRRGTYFEKHDQSSQPWPDYLSSSMMANAAEAAQKIGYINTAQVFQALPQREVVWQKMQEEFKDKAAELQAIQADAKTRLRSSSVMVN